MKLTIAIAATLLACCTCVGLAAAAVTVDKPSPPPCCVDGLCYPKTNTWGYYQGQWRRWPGEELQPSPAALELTPAERVGPEIPPFEAPPPEEEDRRAPTPTKRTEQPPTQPATPPTAVPPGGAPPTDTPPTAAPPAGMPPTVPPTETPTIDTPGELPRLPWEDAPPTGEWDPPPTLPFGTAKVDRQPAALSATRRAGPKLRLPGDLPHSSSTGDLPPPLPLALGGSMR